MNEGKVVRAFSARGHGNSLAEVVAITSLCALATAALSYSLFISFLRLCDPFELEWCEGAMVDVVRRLIAHQPIYAPPSILYTSHEYTPFFYVASAAASMVFGLGYFALRLVSFVSFLGTLCLIAWCIWRETRSAAWSFIAVGLYSATCGILLGWFTVARVDSLYIFLFFAAIAVLRHGGPSVRVAALAGAVLFLAYFTKQTALVMAGPLMLFLCVTDFRRGAVFAFTAVGLAIVSTLILNRVTSGWYYYYTVALLRQQPLVPKLWLGFWTGDLLRPMPCVMFAAAIAIVIKMRTNWRDLFWPSVAAGVVGACWMSRVHQGSTLNSTMPVFVLLAMLSACGGHGSLTLCAPLQPRIRSACAVCVGLLFAAQFWILQYNPWWIVHSEADLAMNQRVADALRGVDGEVFYPFKGNLPDFAGKTSYANGVSTWDLLRGTDTPLKDTLRNEFRRAFADGKFSVIILNRFYADLYPINEARNYDKLPVLLFSSEIAFWTTSNVYVRHGDVATSERLKAALKLP